MAVLGVLQQAVVKALVGEAAFVAQHPGAEPGHRVQHGHGGDLPPGEDKIPQGEFLVHDLVQHPLVHPLVVAAEEEQPGALRKLHRLLLGEQLALGGGEHHIGLLPPRLADRLVAAVDGLGLHQHPLAPAVGAIIHPVVLVAGVVPDVPVPHLYLARPLGPADDALVGDRLAHIYKEGGYLKQWYHRQTIPPGGGSPSVPR